MPRGQRSPDFTQISISIPKALLKDIDEEAIADNRSRSNWIVTELTAAVKARSQSRGKDASTDPPGKSPAGKTQRSAGREDLGSASAGGRLTVFPASRPGLNEDAPQELKPAIPAREKTSGPRVTKTRAALREMQKREGGKKE